MRTRLVDTALFAKFCKVFTQEVNRLRMEGRANVAVAKGEIRKIDRELDTLLDLILKGGAADRINAKMVGLEQRKKEVEAFLGGILRQGHGLDSYYTAPTSALYGGFASYMTLWEDFWPSR
ncbi:hypothetical protein JYP51_18730 [Ponticoccus gilvus]|nr:hypothetical protein [Enemella evansiae]